MDYRYRRSAYPVLLFLASLVVLKLQYDVINSKQVARERDDLKRKLLEFRNLISTEANTYDDLKGKLLESETQLTKLTTTVKQMNDLQSKRDAATAKEREELEEKLVGAETQLTKLASAAKQRSNAEAVASLPEWVTGTPQDFATEMKKGSDGLTDKVDKGHLFQFIYQQNLANLIKRKLTSSSPDDATIRMMEFGLGCAPGGGMIRGTPGGSARGWVHMFDKVEGVTFEYHAFEYDKDCALKWKAEHPGVATMVHVGDASSEEDLRRAYEESGGRPFDVIVDDASHINRHQIKTLQTMLPRLAVGGMYFVEDIVSACRGWRANMGTHRGEGVGGTDGCMTTDDGKETILARLMEYQRALVGGRDGFKDRKEFLNGVTRIEIHFASAMLSKEVESV